jgi:hypothetical protein
MNRCLLTVDSLRSVGARYAAGPDHVDLIERGRLGSMITAVPADERTIIWRFAGIVAVTDIMLLLSALGFDRVRGRRGPRPQLRGRARS